MLLTLFLGMTSCGDKYYEDEYLKNSDEKLCRYVWVEEYVNDANELVSHKLEFSTNHRGIEVFEFRKPSLNGWGPVINSRSKDFTWNWINNMEGLELDFKGDFFYFDNVWVRDNYLSGNYDGVEVTFRKI